MYLILGGFDTSMQFLKRFVKSSNFTYATDSNVHTLLSPAEIMFIFQMSHNASINSHIMNTSRTQIHRPSREQYKNKTTEAKQTEEDVE